MGKNLVAIIAEHFQHSINSSTESTEVCDIHDPNFICLGFLN